ncbi:MAG TPA: hypothetical protein VGF86_07535 [Candidatus Tumulicola sp.]|jgi:hypothetical protein
MRDDEAAGVANPSPRWRDVPENQALVREALATGALGQATAESILNFHDGNGSDPSGVFRDFIWAASQAGKPYAAAELEPEPLEPFEADIVDRLMGGELKTERLV